MKKIIKVILIVLVILFGVILLDTVQAIILKNSPFISRKEKLEALDSWVDKGILIDTYYCTKEQDIVTVSWHFKTSKFTCPIENKVTTYIDYQKTSTLTSKQIDITNLIMFNGILYGKSYAIIDYVGDSESIGVIDKLITKEYIPKLNGETNTQETLNALVFEQTDNTIIILYNNEYVLYEKVNK